MSHAPTAPMVRTRGHRRRSTRTRTCGRTLTTGRGRQSTRFSVLLRTPCELQRARNDVSAGQRGVGDGLACRPGSVPPYGGGDHLSTTTVAGRLQRSTRVLGRAALSHTRARRRGAGLLDLAPGGVYRAGPVARTAGGLLHHRFTLTAPGVSRLRPLGGLRTSTSEGGSLFSVALSRGSPRVAVGHHPALWSPDLPRRTPPVSGRVRRGRPASPSADSVAAAGDSGQSWEESG